MFFNNFFKLCVLYQDVCVFMISIYKTNHPIYLQTYSKHILDCADLCGRAPSVIISDLPTIFEAL